MPPATNTGTSATCGRISCASTFRDTGPIWPPASDPSITNASAPARTSRRAAVAELIHAAGLAKAEQAAASGQLVTNAGAGLTAYVTRTDCAAAAGAALLLPEPAQVYDITGPTAVSTADLAELAGQIGGQPVEVVDVTDEAYVAGLVSAGLPQPVAELLASFGTATREGFMGATSDAVADLTGRPATPLSALVS